MSDQPAATSGHDAPNAAATTAVTVEQPAAILGVSITTVKRRIRAGSLRAEQAHRPQGTVWLVYLDPAATPAAGTGQAAAMSGYTAPTVAATAPTTTPQADAMVSLIQTTIATVLGPLVGQLDAQRQTIERQAETVAQQAEMIGQLRAELAATRAPQSAPEAPGAPDPPDPTTELLPRREPTPWLQPPTPNAAPWWRRWLLAVYG